MVCLGRFSPNVRSEGQGGSRRSLLEPGGGARAEPGGGVRSPRLEPVGGARRSPAEPGGGARRSVQEPDFDYNQAGYIPWMMINGYFPLLYYS